MVKHCLQCGTEIRMGRLCATHATELATSDDFTAEQILSSTIVEPGAWLIDQWGVVHPVADNATVGRDADQCTIPILHHTISSLHAQLIHRESSWQIVDRGSLNGTFVGGLRVRESALQTGDRIGFGDISLFFTEVIHEAKTAQAGPGRTIRSKQGDVAFSVVLDGGIRLLELSERPGGGVALSNDDLTLEFARLEFSLLMILVERRREARNAELAYVSSRELADKLDFRSHSADSDNVRELIRRVRKKFKTEGIVDLIESRQGVGYRIAWPTKE